MNPGDPHQPTDPPQPPNRASGARLRVVIRGAVQGVGFRPFVYRLATEMGLPGWVNNAPQGVFMEVEGEAPALRVFLRRLETEKPPRASIQSLEPSFLDPVGFTAFEVRASETSGAKTALVLPDVATCADCLREILDPADRRHLYPFTNCTNCGPRFTIIAALPYDRAHTTMSRFAMCPACRAEYEDPRDRRFHAQPNACPACGPRLEWWNPTGKVLAARHEALLAAADAIRRGAVVALKGLGGFHLVADARNDEAVRLLRARKAREEKPLALMYPALELAKDHCQVAETEERLLLSPESPIVLLRRRDGAPTDAARPAPSVAPGNPYLGVMLPYTPLHHLLMRELGFPIVATSGNRSEEPICTDENEALERLGQLADFFLVHDRPILRHADDSIVRVVLERELILRRARGYAPLPVPARGPLPPLLAVGAHLKNTVAISVDRNVFVSQHIGDLETEAALDAFRRVIESFGTLYDFHPAAVVCDTHPGYVSTRYAEKTGLPLVRVQHHYAHVRACMGENEIDPPVLGVSWDGTGHGLDDTVWGGEFLEVGRDEVAPDHVGPDPWRRVAHFRAFPLPGGEKAAREPRRAALGLLYEMLGDALFARSDLAPLRAFSPLELRILRRALEQRVNTPLTSSAGRLFDAVCAIIDLRQIARFEGQSAMELEFAAESAETDEAYSCTIQQDPCPIEQAPTSRPQGAEDHPQGTEGHAPPPACYQVDWEPMVRAILEEVARPGEPRSRIAARFHNALAAAVVAMARRVGHERVVLTGGCFQNKYLTERVVTLLRAAGFRAYWHQRIPPNDGGIALGQIMAAAQFRA